MDDVYAMRARLEDLEAHFQCYDGGDRPQNQPVALLREILELRAALARGERQ